MGEHTMEFLHFSENITRLRQAQGLTQEVLAGHIGVTKASVSKWERGQSLPDAPVLAELASFFGVTLDELVGYEPQLGREQIRRIYRELAEDFAKKPFAEVMAVCRRYIRRYGSCWPFLLQMAGLLLNHAPLAPTPEERRDALDEAESLCRRVRERCSDPGLASDASYQEAAAALMRGDAERAAQLEELQDPLRLSSQGELLLLRAYQQAGQTEQARGRVQIGEYLLLLNLTASAATDLALSGADVARCDRLLHRTDALIEDWQLAQLHPNISAQYFYQAALTCMELQRPERALPYLRRFAGTVAALLRGAPILHGDAFFDRLEPWIARMELGGDAPRRLRLTAQDAVRALRLPRCARTRPLPRWRKICRRKPTMLKIDHLTKRYGERIAVDDLSLQIRPGEICAFIGHNGAGKTTTLKACCGILPFEEGEITVGGISVRRDPLACKRQLAYIPDNPDLYDYMSGIGYLRFVADVFGVGTNDRAGRIRRYSESFGLAADLNQPISTYSHGMKQKLAVISALLHEPKLLVMDEPFVGLDPGAAHLLKERMRELCGRGGAIFFSTHVLEVAEKLCDRVAIIRQGRLVRAGTMAQVRGDRSLESVFLELEGGHA